MEFRIADSFVDSLSRLTGDEQKAVKTTAFDLQVNHASPGLSFHKLDQAKDKNFWSVRVNRDVRLIVHRSESSLLLCYVDHHDKAYDWASRRKLETHPKTGAAQFVEIRESVREIVVPVYLRAEIVVPPKPVASALLFTSVSDDALLGYGVPVEWLADAKKATSETLLGLVDHLPAEAAEALLELATGGQPRKPEPVAIAASPFEHADAQRRFRLMTNVDELQRALDFPWDKWTVFLHPEQRQWVEKEYGGPARVSGSAGTGKTIVALHRAAYLARAHPEARVLLTTFSDNLAAALHTKPRRLLANEPRLAERIGVHSLREVGMRLYKTRVGPGSIAPRDVVRQLIGKASSAVAAHKFSAYFLLSEWEQVVDAWQLSTWEEYRDVARLGRKTRSPEAQRKGLWSIFERVQAGLREQKLLTEAEMFTTLAAALRNARIVYDYVLADEAQDLSVAHLRFLAALGGSRPNALFFAGDLGQRIFQQPFSWKSVGVDVRGRSRTLRVNYRTSHQIRMQADRLLASEVSDVDGMVEERGDTVSVFNGPPPSVQVLASDADENRAVTAWLTERISAGVLPHEIGVFVRSEAQLARAQNAVKGAKIPFIMLDDHTEPVSGKAAISTMHLAKGLEFRAVAVMACDDEIVPLQERIQAVGDEADLKDVYDTERQLLYVACTRARDHLLVTAVDPPSEFLDDLRG